VASDVLRDELDADIPQIRWLNVAVAGLLETMQHAGDLELWI
jgi:hypothetical protein